jgi:hypothetical protein
LEIAASKTRNTLGNFAKRSITYITHTTNLPSSTVTTPKTLVIKLFLPALLAFAATTNHALAFAEIARGALLLQTTGTLNYDSYFLATTTTRLSLRA